MPTEAHLRRGGHFVGLHDHKLAIDFRLGVNEVAVCAGNRELIELPAVAGPEPAAQVGAIDANPVFLNPHRLVDRPGGDDIFLLVVLGEGPAGETITDVVFVLGMNILQIVDDIGDDRHPSVGQLEGRGLRFPQGGKLTGGIAAIVPGRDLDEVEGHPFVVEHRAPSFDEVLHLAGVGQAVLVDDVGLALVPNGTSDRKVSNGSDHPVVHLARPRGGDDPWFDGRATPGTVDEPDRNVLIRFDNSSEVIEGC